MHNMIKSYIQSVFLPVMCAIIFLSIPSCLISHYTTPSNACSCRHQFPPLSHSQIHLPNALQIHLIPTQNPITLNTNAAPITTITFPWLSNASLTSNLATFLIFLCKCQLPLFFFSFFLLLLSSLPFSSPVPSSIPFLGAMASLGSTCGAPPRRLQVESLWS